jgi:hypothetical protein
MGPDWPHACFKIVIANYLQDEECEMGFILFYNDVDIHVLQATACRPWHRSLPGGVRA